MCADCAAAHAPGERDFEMIPQRALDLFPHGQPGTVNGIHSTVKPMDSIQGKY